MYNGRASIGLYSEQDREGKVKVRAGYCSASVLLAVRDVHQEKKDLVRYSVKEATC